MTSNEQHFKRDAWLSGRHRVWGKDVPAMDLDFILAEYDRCLPMAKQSRRSTNAVASRQVRNQNRNAPTRDMDGLV